MNGQHVTMFEFVIFFNFQTKKRISHCVQDGTIFYIDCYCIEESIPEKIFWVRILSQKNAKLPLLNGIQHDYIWSHSKFLPFYAIFSTFVLESQPNQTFACQQSGFDSMLENNY